MINRQINVLTSVFLIVLISASAEDEVFCDSVPMQVSPWTYNSTFPKFDSSMGELKNVEIRVVYNLTQIYKIENVGNSNATMNSSMQSVLQLEAPGAKVLMANASIVLFRDLAPFDGMSDFSGPSGFYGNESSSSGIVVMDGLPISDFIATSPDEYLLLRLSSKDSSSFHLSGDLDSKIKTTSGANVCILYNYTAGSSQSGGGE